jgi:glycosyltransferase involved in cell wall biosynthesis
MLRAFRRVRAERPEAVLLLVGRGSLQAEVEALAGTLGLNGQVRFVGPREDVPELMTAADGYVLSSAWEGMPMVLLEAGAAGLPIVATRVGGNQEAVHEGVSGFLVPPSDDQALAAAMLRLMALPEAERRAMGARGQEHVRQRYGLGRVVDRYETIYRRVLRGKNVVEAERSA